MSDSNDIKTEHKPASSVGEILRTKREEKKLSIADVSSQLRLLSKNIQHIENGEWHAFKGRTYARGYFVSYVKLLGLNEEEMLIEFNEVYTENAYDNPSLKTQNLASTDYFKWGRLFFALALIALIWLAYEVYQDNSLLETFSSIGSQTEPDSELEEAPSFE